MEMLAERGARRVVSFDIAPKPSDAVEHPAIEYQQVQCCAPQSILRCESHRCSIALTAQQSRSIRITFTVRHLVPVFVFGSRTDETHIFSLRDRKFEIDSSC